MNVELKSMPFDSNEVYDPATGATSYDRVAYSKDLADWLATYFSNGIVVKGSNILTTELQVTHTGGLNLSVNRGVVVINGRTGWVQEPTELTVDMGGANPRIDRVVMELNIADRFIYLKVLKGTENESPVAPELSQTDDLCHIPLAQVRVEAASAVVGTVTDERAGYLSNVTVGIKPPTGSDAVTVRVSDEVKTKLGLSDADANVDKALQTTENIGMASYLAFCTNANTDSLDSAFGKNNEENISGLGKALAMYGWFKGNSKTDFPFASLKGCNLQAEILANTQAMNEMSFSKPIMALVHSNDYANNIFLDNIQNININQPQLFTKNYDVEITQDILNGTKKLCVAYTMKLPSTGTQAITVTFNGVSLATCPINSTITDCILIDLNTFGVSEVGTYTVTVVGGNTKSYSGNNEVYMDFITTR